MDRLITSSLTSLMTSTSERDRINNKQKIEEAYKKSCYDKNKAFKSSEKDIKNLSLLVLKIKNNIETNLEKMKALKNELSTCKRLLFVRREEVSISWERKIEADTLYKMVKKASKAYKNLDEVQKNVNEENYLLASNLLQNLLNEMSEEKCLKSMFNLLDTRIKKLSSIIKIKLKDMIASRICTKIIPDVIEMIEIPKSSLANFDSTRESAQFNFMDYSPGIDFMDEMNNVVPKILSVLSNIGYFEQTFNEFMQDLEIFIVINIKSLVSKFFETLKLNTPISVQENVNLFGKMSLFYTYRIILLYCSNLIFILCRFIKIAAFQNVDGVNEHEAFKSVFNKIQTITLKLIGNLIQINESENNNIVYEVMKSSVNVRTNQHKENVIDYDNEALIFSMIIDNPNPSKHFIVDSLDLKLSILDEKGEIEADSHIPKMGHDKILSQHLQSIVGMPAFNQSYSDGIKNLPYIYKITYDFIIFFEAMSGQYIKVGFDNLHRHYLNYIVSSIYFSKYIVDIVEKSIKDINSKLSNFETININYELDQNVRSIKHEEQLIICKIENSYEYKEKKLAMAVYDVHLTAKLLIENVSFLEIDWSHSSLIFEHLTRLLNQFQISLSERVSRLFSIVLENSSQESSVKYTNIALSANLVMDQGRFRSFYENFGTLIDHNENFESAMDIYEWFQTEHELLKRLKKYSSKYFINLTNFQRIGILADSLFWFARCYSKELYTNFKIVHGTTIQNCRELLTLSARMMLSLRIEVKLRIILFFNPHKRMETNYKETLGSIGSTICSIYDEIPEDVQKIVFWGFGSFIRINLLEKISDPRFFPKINTVDLDAIVDDILQLKIIWYKIEPQLTLEFNKLIFFCEFLKKFLTHPKQIIVHASKLKKFTYHEYKIMLDASHRSILPELDDETKKAELDELSKIFNK